VKSATRIQAGGKNTVFLRNTFVLLIGLALAGPALAANWADAMFDESICDFGAVPHGQLMSHHFRIKNNTGKVVTIGNVCVSCGCTSATALKSRLNPNEETAVYAQMDTGRFSGSRTVTVFVRFDEPQYEEIGLKVTANSREDLSFSPSTMEFNRLKQGDTSAKTVRITFYAHSQDKIQEATCDSNFCQPTVKEVSRSDSTVEYQLSATLRNDVPVGNWYTTIYLKTNDPAMPKVSVQVKMEVVAP
jgi:hypothetical protein